MAEKLVSQAERHLASKSFWGKPTPNNEAAADLFTSAANSYKQAKAWEGMADCFVRAAECYAALDSVFLSAKAFDSAVMGYEKTNVPKAIDACKRASAAYQIHGTSDRACDLLAKAASLASGPDSVALYTASLDLYAQEDREKYAVDTYKKAVNSCVASEAWTDAVAFSQGLETLYTRLSQHSGAWRQAMVTMLIYFRTGRTPTLEWAQITTRLGSGVTDSAEGAVVLDFFRAYEQGDVELWKQLKASPALQYLDNDVLKMIQALPIPVKRTEVVASAAADLRDEIEEEGFC